jgi:hypothetical protein
VHDLPAPTVLSMEVLAVAAPTPPMEVAKLTF